MFDPFPGCDTGSRVRGAGRRRCRASALGGEATGEGLVSCARESQYWGSLFCTSHFFRWAAFPVRHSSLQSASEDFSHSSLKSGPEGFSTAGGGGGVGGVGRAAED